MIRAILIIIYFGIGDCIIWEKKIKTTNQVDNKENSIDKKGLQL
jgi:hypothetical protein